MRNLKVLGLAFVAVLAMSAVVASAASAAKFNANSGGEDVIVHAKGSNHKFTTNAGAINCETATFLGTGFITPPTSTLDVSPSYGGCEFLLVLGVAVEMNGCTYHFNEPQSTGNPAVFTGTVNVVCPVTEGVEDKIRFSAAGCTVTVGSQSNLGTVTYTNEGGVVHVEANITGIKYTQSGTCLPNGTFTNGTYKGTAIATAENTSGEPVEVFIS